MNKIYDIFIIGGGINGAGIARDAAGRGISVCLVDKGEIGSATSSWSSKLIHGGLRYLENYQFRLVRESLKEREIINTIASSITKTIPFIIPYSKKNRKQLLIRLGLFIYDRLGGKTLIPKSSKVFADEKFPNILKPKFSVGFQYYDIQVDDKKLTKLNTEDAIKKGAKIIEYKEVISAKRNFNNWEIVLKDKSVIFSKILINATGPWVNVVNNDVIKIKPPKNIKLIKGSHLIVNKIYNKNIAFTLQNEDNRIVFVIPYKNQYSLIGTTEVEVASPDNPQISNEEVNYLISTINKYFVNQIVKSDIVYTYSGIRPLIEESKEVSKITRDYFFDLNTIDSQLPLLNIYGGKLTTYRKLSEKVIKILEPYLSIKNTKKWTGNKIL